MPQGIQRLGEVLSAINPHDGWNPHGNCIACAVETAIVLTTGRSPNQIGKFKDEDKLLEAMTPAKELEGKSAAEVFEWMHKKLQAGTVYIAFMDNDDVIHAWNFVRDNAGNIYLIDSNQQVFRKLVGADDGQHTVKNKQTDEEFPTFDMNYLETTTAGLVLYDRGPLHHQWAAFL
jgi:hypothetical protein